MKILIKRLSTLVAIVGFLAYLNIMHPPVGNLISSFFVGIGVGELVTRFIKT